MKIIIDSREQLTLSFEHPYITDVEIAALPVGDYGCEFEQGFQCPVVFERKTLTDLFGTMSQGYERFKRELEKAKDMDLKVILIIEGTLSDVLRGTPHSLREGLSVLRQLFSLWIRYDLIPVFCKDRDEMSTYICEFYGAVGRKALKDLQEAKKVKRQKEN